MAASTSVDGTGSTPLHTPGEPTHAKTSLLSMGTSLLQNFKPLQQIHEHLCAFHFYAYDMRRQVEAHHYCTHYNDEVRQCVIFDSPEPNARLIGVEYILSERLFNNLPDEEKPLWHSHHFEVKGGILFLPGMPQAIENLALKEVVTTYGKVFHFWQYDRGDTLPLGLPQLMMAFTAPGQLNSELSSSVEKRFDVNFEEKSKSRSSIETPVIHPLANSWITGNGLATVLRETPLSEVTTP